MEGKERILTELKSKIGDPSVASKFSNLTERTLTEYVDKLYPSLGEGFEPNDTFYGTHIGILETLAGNIRFAASSAVEDYKKKNPAKTAVEPPKATDPIEPKSTDDAALAILKSLKDEIDSIKADRAGAEKKARLDKNISEAKSKLQSNGADNASVLNLAFRLIDLTGEESVDDITAKAKAEYDKQVSELYGAGYSPMANNEITHINVSSEVKEKREKAKEMRKNMNV